MTTHLTLRGHDFQRFDSVCACGRGLSRVTADTGARANQPAPAGIVIGKVVMCRRQRRCRTRGRDGVTSRRAGRAPSSLTRKDACLRQLPGFGTIQATASATGFSPTIHRSGSGFRLVRTCQAATDSGGRTARCRPSIEGRRAPGRSVIRMWKPAASPARSSTKRTTRRF